ncbi:MAG: hypothetical protein RIB63_11700, partial [Fulvivirga sp.]
MSSKNILLFIILILLAFSSCDDENVFHGRIKKVQRFNQDNEHIFTEVFNYNESGQLISIRQIRNNSNEGLVELIYDGLNLIQINDGSIKVNFKYNSEGDLINLKAQYINFDFKYEDNEVSSINDFFVFNYDDRKNLISIINSENSNILMIKDSFEYDQTPYVFSALPKTYKLYKALLSYNRNIPNGVSFQFNTGENNISVRHSVSSRNQPQFDSFSYQYNLFELPSKLTIESFTQESNGL